MTDPQSQLQFNDSGLLPPGIHEMGIESMKQLLGFTQGRLEMITYGLSAFIKELKPYDVQEIYIDGSFVTSNPLPRDIDGFISVKFGDRLFEFLINDRKKFKTTFNVDFYPAFVDMEGEGSLPNWIDFFQGEREGGSIRKGLILLRIKE